MYGAVIFFLNDINSRYIHSQYNHFLSIFGETSRTEGIWGELKFLIKKYLAPYVQKILFTF